MRRFRFPLETVRRWRLERAGIEELALRQMLRERQKIAAIRAQIESERDQNVRELLAQPSVGSLDLESLDSFRLYVRGRVRELEQQAHRCEVNIGAQREKVLEARRQFELLERLRQKTLTEWRLAGNKEQEETAADLFLAKTIRERRRAGVSRAARG